MVDTTSCLKRIVSKESIEHGMKMLNCCLKISLLTAKYVYQKIYNIEQSTEVFFQVFAITSQSLYFLKWKFIHDGKSRARFVPSENRNKIINNS